MAVRKKFIERLAMKLLREADQWGPPARLDTIAKRLGIALVVTEGLAKGTRAAFDPDRSVIDVAPLPREQTRFSVAHELGHAALDHGGRCSFEGEPSLVDVELDLHEAETGLDHEGEANYFAGRLLVPRAWLQDAVKSHTRDQLLEMFGVSNSVLLIAAQEYRLFNQLSV